MKTTVRQNLPSPSSFDEEPKVLTNPFEKSPILIVNNVDFADSTIESPIFHIEDYFENIGQVSKATLEKVHILDS